MENIECKEVIISRLSRRGKGVENSPIRVITEVFEKDGTLIAEFDPCPETFSVMDLVHFARWCFNDGIITGKVNQNDVNKWLVSIKNVSS